MLKAAMSSTRYDNQTVLTYMAEWSVDAETGETWHICDEQATSQPTDLAQ